MNMKLERSFNSNVFQTVFETNSKKKNKNNSRRFELRESQKRALPDNILNRRGEIDETTFTLSLDITL